MKVNDKTYKCSACGKTHVKLWRPYGDCDVLLCASCAEKRQIPLTYEENEWIKKNDNLYIGTPTGNIINAPRWTVEENGLIQCTYRSPDPFGNFTKTNQLMVNVSDLVEERVGETTMIPAIPTDDGTYWAYTAVPEKDVKQWELLPNN